MKKVLSILLLTGTLLGATLTPVLAENYKYKLYDPQTKKTTYSFMMTISGRTDDAGYYYIAFRHAGGFCVVDTSSLNRNPQGLLGGKCLNYDAKDGRFSTWSWRELYPGNYYAELRDVENERRQEGKHMENFSIEDFSIK